MLTFQDRRHYWLWQQWIMAGVASHYLRRQKLTSNVFEDIGQGILDLVEEVYLENGPAESND